MIKILCHDFFIKLLFLVLVEIFLNALIIGCFRIFAVIFKFEPAALVFVMHTPIIHRYCSDAYSSYAYSSNAYAIDAYSSDAYSRESF